MRPEALAGLRQDLWDRFGIRGMRTAENLGPLVLVVQAVLEDALATRKLAPGVFSIRAEIPGPTTTPARVEPAPESAPSSRTEEPMTEAEVASLREWLASWGEGPNWMDKTGATVPIAKVYLRRLLAEVARLTRERDENIAARDQACFDRNTAEQERDRERARAEAAERDKARAARAGADKLRAARTALEHIVHTLGEAQAAFDSAHKTAMAALLALGDGK